MIGKDYFARQATTLLRMAKTVKDPQIQAGLAAKAADLKDRHEETPPQRKRLHLLQTLNFPSEAASVGGLFHFRHRSTPAFMVSVLCNAACHWRNACLNGLNDARKARREIGAAAGMIRTLSSILRTIRR